MAQVRRELGELGGISVTERTHADGKTSFVARAKGRRLDGKTISVEAAGRSRRAAEQALKARWEHRRTERTGSTPPRRGDVSAATSSTRLTSTSPLRDVVLAWLADEEHSVRTRPQTTRTYRTTAERHIIPALGSIGLHELTAGTITDHLRELRAGSTPSAVESVMKVLHRVNRFAAQRALTTHDFTYGVEIPRAVRRERPQRETIAAGEAAGVLALADAASPVLGLIMRVVAETGARPGEVLALHPGQLHPDEEGLPPFIEIDGTVVAGVKGRGAFRQAEGKTPTSHRRVAVTRETMDRLLIQAEVAPAAESASGLRPLFPSRTGGWKSVSTVNADLRRALAGTELVGITPRVFRRTLATALAGVAGDQAAADQLGHGRVSTTGRHYVKEGLVVRDGATVLTDFLAGAE